MPGYAAASLGSSERHFLLDDLRASPGSKAPDAVVVEHEVQGLCCTHVDLVVASRGVAPALSVCVALFLHYTSALVYSK